MDCLEFRRRLAAEPHSRDPELLAHRDSCRAGCAESWWGAQRFEQRIHGVLQSVEAPPDLAERVLLAQATSEHGRSRRRWQAGLALAASLLVALVVAGYAWNLRANANGGAVAVMAVAHMSGETFALKMTRPVGDARLRLAFTRLGLTLHSATSRAVYATDCEVGPYHAVHLVLREDGKPVTALYVIGPRIAQAQTFVRGGWHGRELQMGSGTLVLLGHGTEGFTAAEYAVADAVLGPARRALGEI